MTNEQKTKLIGFLCLLAIFASAAAIYWQATRDPRQDRDTEADRSAGSQLAREMLRRIDPSGNVVVVIIRPLESENPMVKGAYRGFKEELAQAAPSLRMDTVALLDFIRSTFGEGRIEGMFGEEGIPAPVFDRLVQDHRDATAIVSLVGFPAVGRPDYNRRNRPFIAGMDPMFITGNAWATLLDQSYIDLIVLPTLDPSETPKAGPDTLTHYQVVTRENLGSAAADYFQ